MISKKKTPILSDHFQSRKPSDIRKASIEFAKRIDGTEAINVAIGNVSLPMHPVMTERMFNLGTPESPFRNGVVCYTQTIGFPETNQAYFNILASSGFKTEGLYSQITDGGSQAMELVIKGVAGKINEQDVPFLTIDPTYTNYPAMAERVGVHNLSVIRNLQEDGKFTLPNIKEIEGAVKRYQLNALLVIPYDNPTGHYYPYETMVALAKLCVKHNLWMVSDEAYRELYYISGKTSSVWALNEQEVPGIIGRRISIESASKVWNGCGLRIGAIITDNKLFHEKAVAENTANLCAPAIDQWIFGALAHLNHQDLKKWYQQQREYYKAMLFDFTKALKDSLPGVIVSSPDASIYSVIDVRNCVKPGFNALQFVMYCASEGKVAVDGKNLTLLVSPMAGFYNVKPGEKNPGQTQMRIAYVETPENMQKIPRLFVSLLEQYESR